jgi:hypothetical protein
LPVSLHLRGYPLAVVTLRNRTLNPLVALFIDHLREVARSMPPRLVPGGAADGKMTRRPRVKPAGDG